MLTSAKVVSFTFTVPVDVWESAEGCLERALLIRIRRAIYGARFISSFLWRPVLSPPTAVRRHGAGHGKSGEQQVAIVA
jgi:hypothetical protein